jgi:hypothetical protein
MVDKNSNHPTRGTSPIVAANAIGTPHENATPRTNWGVDRKRFVKG